MCSMLYLEIGLSGCVPHLNTVSDISLVTSRKAAHPDTTPTLAADGSLAEPDRPGPVRLPEEVSY